MSGNQTFNSTLILFTVALSTAAPWKSQLPLWNTGSPVGHFYRGATVAFPQHFVVLKTLFACYSMFLRCPIWGYKIFYPTVALQCVTAE